MCFTFRKQNEKVRKIQEAQRKKREEDKAAHREKSIEGMKRKETFEAYSKNEEDADEEPDDDAEYYRQEVGKEPEKGISTHVKKETVSLMLFALL